MTELQLKYQQLEQLQEEIKELEAEARKERNAKRKLIKTTDRKGSVILTREDGLSIVVSKTKNSYGECKVNWYDGKKGEVIDNNSRAYLDIWKDFLAEYKVA